MIHWKVFFFFFFFVHRSPWLSLVKSASDESCIGSKWGRHPRERAQQCLSSPWFHLPPCVSGHRLAFLDGCHCRRPYRNTEPYGSGFYLVLSNDKTLPHSTAPAAGTCWCPSVKGIVYVPGDPELISIPPSSFTLLFFLLIWRLFGSLSSGGI